MSNTPVWMRVVCASIKENSPALLSGIAAAGVIATVALAVRATPKAERAMKTALNEKINANPETEESTILQNGDGYRYADLTWLERIQVTWRIYLPAGISGVATIACIAGANAIGARQTAAVAGAYTLVDAAFRDYKEKVLEQIGATKEQKVRDAIAQDRLEKNPVANTQVIVTGGGDERCYDLFTDRYFKSDIELVRRAENEINARILREMGVPLNEFYELLGVGSCAVGDILGFDLDHLVELVFGTHLSSDGKPCFAIDFRNAPVKDYGKF